MTEDPIWNVRTVVGEFISAPTALEALKKTNARLVAAGFSVLEADDAESLEDEAEQEVFEVSVEGMDPLTVAEARQRGASIP